jgi:hypothetical protein
MRYNKYTSHGLSGWDLYRSYGIKTNVCIHEKKVKQSCYRPGVGQRVPGSLGSQISWQWHRMVVRLSALRTGHLYPQEIPVTPLGLFFFSCIVYWTVGKVQFTRVQDFCRCCRLKSSGWGGGGEYAVSHAGVWAEGHWLRVWYGSQSVGFLAGWAPTGNQTLDLPVCSVVPLPLRHCTPRLLICLTLKSSAINHGTSVISECCGFW